MELKTLTKIKDDYAEGLTVGNYNDWDDVLIDYFNGEITREEFIHLENEAIKLYALQIAEAACKEQRELCAKGLREGESFVGIHQNKVLNAPIADIDKLLK